MIAKIAHAGMIQRVGVEGFESYLPPVIIEPTDKIYDYVGCLSEDKDLKPDKGFSSWIAGKQLEDGTMLMKVRLLCQLETPVYTVVSGRRIQQLARLVS